MYNENFKLRYMEENEFRNASIKTNVDLLFRKIEPSEEKLNKDLYDFNVKEILDYYKSLCTPSLESLMIMNNQYKLYTAYAIREGLVKDNQNHYQEIDNVQLSNCINLGLAQAQIVTREDLLFILNSVYVTNISDRFMCLALFEGLGGKMCEELTQLLPSNILPEGRVKLCTGREFNVSQQFVDWGLESAEEYEYYGEGRGKLNYYMQDDPRCVKRFANSISEEPLRLYKSLVRRLNKVRESTMSQAIGVSTLQESGRLEMIRNLMEKDHLTLRQAIRDENVEYIYGRIPSIPRYCLRYGLTED